MSATTVMPAASPRRPARKATSKAAAAATADGSTARTLPLDQLVDHPDNPRSAMTDVEQLAATIEGDGGLLQAIVVAPLHLILGPGAVDDGRFVIVAGHRRRAAVAHLGWTEVRCEVRTDLDSDSIRGAMLTENMQRVDLTPLEEAYAFDRLQGDGWSQRRIAEVAGCTQPHVSKRLSLLKLAPPIRGAVEAGTLPVADALTLGTVKGERSQARAYERLTTTKHGYRQAVDAIAAVKEENQAVARETAFELACNEVSDNGWPRVKDRPQYGSSEQLHDAKAIKAHQKAPACYVVYVNDYGQLGHFCIKPKVHAKAAAANPHAEKERRDKRERKTAMDLRTVAAERASWHPLPAADLLEQLTALAFGGSFLHSGSHGMAAGWLRALYPMYPEAGYACSREVERSGDARVRGQYLRGILLGDAESRARDLHGRWDASTGRYLHRLHKLAGYSPTDWERERLREQVGIVDVDGFLAADDPAVHLPGQPTLHAELGTEPANGQPVEHVHVDGDLL